MNKILFICFSILVVSCANMGKGSGKAALGKASETFNYSDKNGQFVVQITSGPDKSGKGYFTKKVMELPNRQKDKVLEQSVVISTIGAVKKNTILRPKLSQYNVWFDGKKYTSELKINAAKKAIDVKMTSPEKQWNGTRQVKFPSSTIVPCFFSQVIDCAKVAGFINKASDKKSGTMNLLIIWEGYPYLNETFSDFPSELFSEGVLEYDGKTTESERRFNLRVAGQSIFYVLNDKSEMSKMFWVSQGISMVGKSAKVSQTQDEGGDF